MSATNIAPIGPRPRPSQVAPRAMRVRRPATFWVSHCISLLVSAGCVLGLVIGLLAWQLEARNTSNSVGAEDGGISAPVGDTSARLLLDDQFSGTQLDTTRWNTFLGTQGAVWNDRGLLALPYSAPNAPGSDNAAMFGPNQVSVHNGLTLTAQRNTTSYASIYPWISGVVTSSGLSLPAAGWYVQVKAKMPDMTEGTWPAIWFMPNSPTDQAPEIDLFEGGWLGANPNELMHVDFGGGRSLDPNYRDAVYDTRTDLTAGYHVYGIQYEPNKAIRYFFDGKEIFQQLASDPGGVPTGTYELLLQLQMASSETSGWHTLPTATTPSETMAIAEVQVYS